MKKYFFIVISFFLFNSIKAQDFNNIIKVNPMAYWCSFNVTYEKPINDSSSAFARVLFFYNFNLFDSRTKRGIGIEAGYRFYVLKSKSAPNGFFLSPTVTINPHHSNVIFALSGELGYQWVWDSGFVLDIYGGVSSVYFPGNNFQLYFPVGGIAFGHAF
jgi:hypothetical protein